jgi:hypothetical protein
MVSSYAPYWLMVAGLLSVTMISLRHTPSRMTAGLPLMTKSVLT